MSAGSEEILRARKLRRFAVKIAPIHIYASVMEYLRPEKVLSKDHTLKAYPVRGEFVIDIDAYMNFKRHRHKTEPEGFCNGCLEQAKELKLKLLELVEINYKDILIVFSGKHGFHIHARDFEVRDWTYYDARNPLKSHEVARAVNEYPLARVSLKEKSGRVISIQKLVLPETSTKQQ